MFISYRNRASVGAGLVAALAEERKSEKFAHLSSHYHFVPFAIESLGAMGPSATALIKDLSFRGSRETGENRFGSFLVQRLSIAIQRGNASSVLGTIPSRT